MPIKLSSLKTHDLSSRPQLQVTCNIQPQQQFDSTTPKTKQHIFGNIIGWRGAPSQKKTIQSGRFPSRSLSLSPLPSDQICLSLSVVPIIFVCLVHTIPISDVNQPEILIFWWFNPHSGKLNYRFRWINDDKSTFCIILVG